MKIDVSFIVPFYQGSDSIVKCIDSIYEIGLRQDLFEVIVVDDCSPDSAEKSLGVYAKSHPNLRIIRHDKNKRQGGAKNTGIKAAIGDYIVFADQDDYVIPKNQKQAIERALATRPDMLACKWLLKQEDGSTIVCGLDLADGISKDGKTYCETWFDAGKCLAPWSYLYKRDFLIKMAHPMAENVLMEDADWIAWHLFYALRVEFMNLPIYCWVMNPSSITHGLSWRHKADWVKFGYRKIKDSVQITKDSSRFGTIMEKDGRHNIEHVFKKLWRIDDYSRFYQHIGEEVLKDLQTMEWSKQTSFMLYHPSFVCLCLKVVGPALKSIRAVKNKFKI